MKTIEISQKLRKSLEKELKPDRFDHTLGVAYTAANMAFIHGEDVEKALIAGFLHDCAKCMSHEDQIKICEKNKIEISEVERRNHSLLHAKVGMFLARTKYDVYDTDILNAIRWHTTGREGMSLLEKIVFISDYIEPTRNKAEDLSSIRYEAFNGNDIDKVLLMIMRATIKYLNASDNSIDKTTISAYEFYEKG